MVTPLRRGCAFVAFSLTVLLVASKNLDEDVFRFRIEPGFQANDYPFRNTSLPWDKRVDDLVSRLTLEEMQDQMAHGGAKGPAPAIPRLGIGPYQWDTECLRGPVQEDGVGTGFPQAIGLAATFDHHLMAKVSEAIGVEVRGKHNDFVKNKVFHLHTGASCFSPVVNIARDPRWGRNQETYGEDPYLTSVLAHSYVTHLQGNDSRYIRASAGCKHFDVHSGPDNIPVDRSSFNAEVTDEDWRTTYLPAFKTCVKAGSYNIMCSYNRINGVPACANKKLLTDILRKKWGFKGYVISDEDAVSNIMTQHHYTNNTVDTVMACVNAGCNLELSSTDKPVYLSLTDAVKAKKVTMDTVRESVKPLFYTRMRLGEFDPPDKNPYAKLDSTVVETPKHKALAVEAAMKSFVLLKNDQRLLPVNMTYKNVSMIGPMADNYEMLAGDYQVFQPRRFTKTPLEALRGEFKNLRYMPACLDKTPCKNYSPDVVKKVVKGSELVFVVLGTGVAIEAEGRDRPDLELPGHQKQLLLDVIKYANESQPHAKIVLLLFNAGPLNISFAHDSSAVQAIMECFFPAQATGEALVNVLFNKGGNSSPGGKLPMTWPKYASQVPPMTNYSMAKRTYRYMKPESKPLYAFGYGMTYSDFFFHYFKTRGLRKPHEDIPVEVHVINDGDFDAEEVIQCYIFPYRIEEGEKAPDIKWPRPRSQLGAISRKFIPAKKMIIAHLRLSWKTWAFWSKGKWQVIDGIYTIGCGGGQHGLTASTTNFIYNYFHVRSDNSTDVTDSDIVVTKDRTKIF